MNTSVSLKPGERVDALYSLNIRLIQSSQVFCFSLDAVLLAHFIRPNLRHRLLTVDLCAGNGAVGMFIHQKTGGHLVEVELQPEVADMAKRSVQLNGLIDRYQVIAGDVKEVYQWVPKGSADQVLCNPPYFPVTAASRKNPNCHLAIARHEIAIDLETVVDRMSGLLKMNGRGYLVHRPDRLPEILACLTNHRLAPKRIQFIYPKAGSESNMVLIEATKDGRPGGCRIVSPVIVHHQNGEYTPQIKEMLYGKKKAE